MTSTTDQSIRPYKELVEIAIQDITLSGRPDSLYEPIRYTLTLGGKRMRPILTLLACEMAGGTAEQALEPALGIELFHNFTLLHDDIMDQAPLRRGKPTVFSQHGINTAILSGDVIMVKAYQLIAKAPQDKLALTLEVFNRTAIEVCEGQQMDLEYETRLDVSIDAYLEMIGLKTAALLAGSMEIGALIGGSTREEARQYHQVGWHMGIAFQLQDDLLDTYGDPGKFGKQVGGDIIQNKKTFLLLKALELADDAQRDTLQQWIGTQAFDPNEKVASVRTIYDHLNVRSLAEQERDSHYEAARKPFETLKAVNRPKAIFQHFADQLLNRQH